MRATTVVAQVSSATPQQLARSVNFNVFQNKTPGRLVCEGELYAEIQESGFPLTCGCLFSLTRHVNEEKENSGVGHDKILNGYGNFIPL